MCWCVRVCGWWWWWEGRGNGGAYGGCGTIAKREGLGHASCRAFSRFLMNSDTLTKTLKNENSEKEAFEKDMSNK